MPDQFQEHKVIHIVGIVGLPGRYGGFETLADYIVESDELRAIGIVVYCEQAVVDETGPTYKSAQLVPLRWKANGWQSMIYDAVGMFRASVEGGRVLILGASATIVLPFLRLIFPQVRYYVNMAGLEWKRSKWGPVAKSVIKINEWAAARFSHKLVADNEGLVDYCKQTYGIDAVYIPYGGDQYLDTSPDLRVFDEWPLPDGAYDFALARAQSDNNLELILDAYARSGQPLVYLSNWDSSEYGRNLKTRYAGVANLHLVGPIYDVGRVKALQSRARLYVHGHSAGGTNPALVEAMWGGLPTLAFDVSFNRHTTDNRARYFADSAGLLRLLESYSDEWARTCGPELRSIAQRKFTWASVRASYVRLLRGES